MDAAHSTPIVLKADIEHSGVRVLVLATLLVVFLVFFLILSVILRSFTDSLVSEFYIALSCILALPLAIGAAGLSEFVAKRRWPSGRSVSFDNRGVLATTDKDKSFTYRWDGHISAIKWYFHMKGYRRGGRERRIPAGWLCVACQLQQDEHRFIVYSYMSVKAASQIIADNRFMELRPAEFYQTSVIRKMISPPTRPEIPTKVLAGKQGHYWMAERRRWTEGMELELGDFQLFLDIVDKRIEQ
jgi:hypothetical protein